MSFSVRHIGDPQELVKVFHKALAMVMEKFDTLLSLYRRMVEVRLTKEGAEKLIALKFSAKYYKCTSILIRNDGIELRRYDSSLWDTFNTMSRVLTHESCFAYSQIVYVVDCIE
ncbi:MAG: DUF932 domain-containing protein [Candidatus Nitrosocaldus sp.]